MENDIFYGVPILLTKGMKASDYVHALCYCPVPNGMCIRIPKTWPHKNNVYNFHCNDCGLEGIVILREVDDADYERYAAGCT